MVSLTKMRFLSFSVYSYMGNGESRRISDQSVFLFSFCLFKMFSFFLSFF